MSDTDKTVTVTFPHSVYADAEKKATEAGGTVKQWLLLVSILHLYGSIGGDDKWKEIEGWWAKNTSTPHPDDGLPEELRGPPQPSSRRTT
ncbi:hypothetical protein CCP3SC15_1780005 [Gammaproteobacteria bacterium]